MEKRYDKKYKKQTIKIAFHPIEEILTCQNPLTKMTQDGLMILVLSLYLTWM